MKNWLSRWRHVNPDWHDWLLLLLPVAIWFSYLPNLHIGQIGGANVEFSITEIYLVIFALTSLPLIWRQRRFLAKNRMTQAVIGGAVLVGLSLLWTSNLPRGLLTFGVIGVLVICFLAFLANKKLPKIWPFLKSIFIASVAAMSIIAIIQVIYGIWWDFGLCSGCVATGFGFARPNVFTIEPQFFGSLLIAPMVLLIHKYLGGKAGRFDIVAMILTLFALSLTLSRGAIFAVALGVIILFIINRRNWQKILKTIAIIAAIFAGSLVFDGAATSLNPRVSDGFTSSIAKTVNHLSMGLIDIPVKTLTSDQPIAAPAVFDGYVKKSTTERLNMTELSLQTWRQNAGTVIFGVGLGGSGQSIYDHTDLKWNAEISQNQYVETLLENGLLGLLIFLTAIGYLFYLTRRHKWLWAILAAYLLQWNMFSGLPNALHIYLAIGLIYVTINNTYGKKIEQKH
ncbi:MAG: O-antigen ligase family protein [Candidatus Nomurabacteria bacterium]|jgi:hypothetical protein|nr:O-antigen ligase family protein [Candidatus Nomurabacteria bacterium]